MTVEVVTLDINPKTVEVAEQYWKKSRHGKKIRTIIGPALETLKSVKGPFDFMFIDGDKPDYISCLQRGLELLSPRGIIVADNCLWAGRVLEKSLGGETRKPSKNLMLSSARIPLSRKLYFPCGTAFS